MSKLHIRIVRRDASVAKSVHMCIRKPNENVFPLIHVDGHIGYVIIVVISRDIVNEFANITVSITLNTNVDGRRYRALARTHRPNFLNTAPNFG